MLKRIFDIIDFQTKRHPTPKALSIKQAGKWKNYSSEELETKVKQVAQGLLDLGLAKSDTIIIIPRAATPHTIFLDLAVQMIGLIPLIAHATTSKEDLEHIITEAKPKIIFYANELLRDQMISEGIKTFIISEDQDSVFQKTFIAKRVNDDQLRSISESISEEDLALVAYTSGSTGLPKGVMLTHKNIMSNMLSVMSLLPVGPGAVTVNYLPFSHILERASVYMGLAMGFRMHIIDEIFELRDTLQEIRPSFITAVPRIIEKMLEGLESYRSEKGFFTKKLLRWAIEVGLNYNPHKGFRPVYAFNNLIARYVVLGKLRKATGGKLKGLAVGGAHLRPDLANLLEVAGIKVREGYGMTETSPIITFNRFEPGMNKTGTVGIPISNVEIKLDIIEDGLGGEILVKGPNITSGYYNQPQLNDELFDAEGWLRTGDIGTLDSKGFLTITDRKKDIFKTSAGKYVAPQLLENLFKGSLHINQILIIGFHRSFITALIVPNYNTLEKWAVDNDIHWTSPTYMAHNIKIREKIEEDIDEVNKTLPNFKRIKKFALLDSEWNLENGLLSSSLKPRRKLIENQFKKQIIELYKDQKD